MRQFNVVTSGLEFPEGPVAMSDGSLYVVEVRGQRLTRIAPNGDKQIVAQIPGGPNGAALGPDGKMYICNNGGYNWTQSGAGWTAGPPDFQQERGGAIQRVDLATGNVETLFTHFQSHPLNAPNDLVFDRAGGLWFTDMGKSRHDAMDHGALYYVSPGAASLNRVAAPMLGPNGIGLSPDERTIYVAEMPPARLWAFDRDEAGNIKPPAHPVRGEKGHCIGNLPGYQMFDSLAVEACGNICIATMLSGHISVFTPKGDLLEQVPTDDVATSNIAFGGSGMRTAFVTRARQGDVVAYIWPRPGLRLNFAA